MTDECVCRSEGRHDKKGCLKHKTWKLIWFVSEACFRPDGSEYFLLRTNWTVWVVEPLVWSSELWRLGLLSDFNIWINIERFVTSLGKPRWINQSVQVICCLLCLQSTIQTVLSPEHVVLFVRWEEMNGKVIFSRPSVNILFCLCLMITWAGYNMVCKGVIKGSGIFKSLSSREAASLSCERRDVTNFSKRPQCAPARPFPTWRTCAPGQSVTRGHAPCPVVPGETELAVCLRWSDSLWRQPLWEAAYFWKF